MGVELATKHYFDIGVHNTLQWMLQDEGNFKALHAGSLKQHPYFKSEEFKRVTNACVEHMIK